MEKYLELSGFKISENIHAGNHTSIYRAIRNLDKQAVVIKTHTDESPVEGTYYRLRREFKIGQKINSQHVIRYIDKVQVGSRLAVILEDFSGDRLSNVIPKDGLSPLKFLNIAISMTEGISSIHQHNIIHKNITPSNILIHPELDEVKFIDFGNASELQQEPQPLNITSVCNYSLIYSSPEQTGRMNRTLDYRTDYYSLGVCFYELLCGHPPFSASDPLGLIHCHIAKQPIPLNEEKKEIPKIISDCVMKLLSKNAEDRYQSSFGLKNDLEKCVQLLSTKNYKTFKIGMHDQFTTFHIHQKLYGRESEISKLLSNFEQVSTGKVNSKFTTVSGYSGIGKTSLIQEVQKPLVRDKGNFIAGKYDQLKRNIPYSSFIQAYQSLIKKILAESDKSIELWKTKLLAALGKNAQIIIDVIPQVELIVGAQPDVPILGSLENQNRFNRVFLDFSRVFCKKEHPLVIFLDDLQWADIPTLNLIKLLITDPETQFLFIIGAYRDNEVDESHPLTRTIREIETQTSISKIVLHPLTITNVNRLIADSMICSQKYSEPLSELVYKKTLGNPFFVGMFLKRLADEKLVKFDYDKGQWNWNLEDIKLRDITDNVVELMIDRIKNLSDQAQRVLSLAACIGDQFNLKTLSLIYDKSSTNTFIELWGAIDEGLIIPIEDEYKWVEHTGEKYHKAIFRFLHDRVQQAAYSLISNEDRPKLHLRIGRLLLENWEPEEVEENIFEIVNHFNTGKEFIEEEEEKMQITLLNLKSAKKAKLSSAYYPALSYIKAGKEFLPKKSWENYYELTLSYYFEKGELEYLTANWDQSISTFDEALSNVKSLLERCIINKYKVTLYRMKNDLKTSLQIGIEALNELNIPLEAFPDETTVNKEINQLKNLIENKNSDSLYNLPDLKDPLQLIALEIIKEVFAPAYFLGSRLISIIGIKMTEITIKEGNSIYAAVGYIFYSAITLAVNLSDYDNAYKYGKLALRLNNEKYHDKANEALILDMWGTFICHHKTSLNFASDALLEGHYSGVEHGSYQWAGYCGVIHLFTCFWGLHTLSDVSNNILKLAPGMKRIDPNMVEYYFAVKATVFNLTNNSPRPVELSKSIWRNMDKVLQIGHEQDDLLTLLVDSTCRIFLANIFHDVDTALELAEHAERYAVGSPGVFINPVFNFHQCLAFCQAYETAKLSTQAELIQKIKIKLTKLNLWASHCPETYFHQATLIQAELARIQNKVETAMELYDIAIDSARENGFKQNQAYANELASRFYLSIGRKRISWMYLKNSCAAYQEWGALAKVTQIKEKNPQLYIDVFSDEGISKENKNFSLDSDSLIKATQSISCEINTDSLLKQLMKILLENAGAEKGCFIVPTPAEGYFTVVSGNIEHQKVQLDDYLPIEENTEICPEIINYVVRTREPLVLDDASNSGLFQNTSYIIETQPKSIICIPVLYKRQLKGIIYLENNISVRAFNIERVKTLEIITSQAAISIENANLYSTLESKVEARTADLRNVNVELKLREQEANEKKKRLMQILDTAVDSIAIINNVGIIETFNTAAEGMFGYTAKEVIGRKVNILMNENDGNLHDNYIKNYIDTNEAKVIGRGREVLAKKKNGTEFWISLAISELKLGDDIVFTGVMHDITKQKEDEKALTTAKEEAEKANLAKSEFLSRMSHELRTPMNAILGFTQLLQLNGSSTMDEHQIEGLNEIYIAGKHLLVLINEVLEISQIEAGKITVKIKDVSIKELYKDMESLIASIAKSHGIKISINIPERTYVSVDPIRLKQVIINLMTNAIKYNRENGSVTLDVYNYNDKIRIDVIDTGLGIPAKNIEKVFLPFERLGAETGNIEGTGIGLTISKKIIEIMDGNIGVESKLNKGSCFWVTLPPAKTIPKENKNNRIHGGKKVQKTHHNFTLLYIEDNPANLRLVDMIINAAFDINFVTAIDGKIGIEMAKACKPDLILIDIQLPDINGIEVKKKMELINGLEKTPTIAVSANVLQNDVDDIMSAGFVKFISKPIDVKNFTKLIGSYIHASKSKIAIGT